MPITHSAPIPTIAENWSTGGPATALLPCRRAARHPCDPAGRNCRDVRAFDDSAGGRGGCLLRQRGVELTGPRGHVVVAVSVDVDPMRDDVQVAHRRRRAVRQLRRRERALVRQRAVRAGDREPIDR